MLKHTENPNNLFEKQLKGSEIVDLAPFCHSLGIALYVAT